MTTDGNDDGLHVLAGKARVHREGQHLVRQPLGNQRLLWHPDLPLEYRHLVQGVLPFAITDWPWELDDWKGGLW